jgi:hypothetical protein
VKGIYSFLSVLVVVLAAFGSDDAFAYIDPGTGSLVLQMVIAGIFSGLFAIKMFWARIKEQFNKIFGSRN